MPLIVNWWSLHLEMTYFILVVVVRLLLIRSRRIVCVAIPWSVYSTLIIISTGSRSRVSSMSFSLLGCVFLNNVKCPRFSLTRNINSLVCISYLRSSMRFHNTCVTVEFGVLTIDIRYRRFTHGSSWWILWVLNMINWWQLSTIWNLRLTLQPYLSRVTLNKFLATRWHINSCWVPSVAYIVRFWEILCKIRKVFWELNCV